MTSADTAELTRLLAVQEHDRALDALAHQRAHLPELAELEALAETANTLGAAEAEVNERRHELERGQKRLEDEVALLEDRIAQEDGKLYGGEVVGVKELQALQDEIKGLKARQRVVEDQIIEIMEAAEPVDAELATLATKRRELDASSNATNQRLDEARAALDGEAADTEGERSVVAGEINAGLLAVYENLRSQPGRIGVAKLVGFTCRGCHLELPAVEVDRLKKLPSDALVHCDECGCILVR